MTWRWRSGSIIFRSYSTRSERRAAASRCSRRPNPVVSSAVWIEAPWQASRNPSKNHCCASGSPPEKVTPPPEAMYNTRSWSASPNTSWTSDHPADQLARAGRAGVHARRAPTAAGIVRRSGPSPARLPARDRPPDIRRRRGTGSRRQRFWDAAGMPSGLWHQTQQSGQPFRKTVVRMPGPSSVLNCWTLKRKPVVIKWGYYSPNCL